MTKALRMDRRENLLAHLDELLKRLRRSVLWVFLGVLVGYTVAGRLVLLLEQPLLERLPEGARIVFTTPFEKFWAYLRVATLAGFALVLPFLGVEAAGFVGPALKQNEKRRTLWLILSTGIVFILGLYCGYRFVLPPVIEAVLRYGGNELPLLTVSAYLNAVIGVLILTALFLEIPLVMVHLSSWGWVEAASWAKGRRIAFVLNAVVSAVLSPPDIFSMIVMMIPLQLLYECGILGARMARWWTHEKKIAQ
jgi:sec-independent protein translocase protein TatC